MRKLFIVLLLFFCVMFAFAHAQADSDVELTPQRPSRNSDRSKIYDLPEDAVPESESHLVNNILAGTESGLYKIVGSDTPVPLWTEGRVTQIVETQVHDTQIWYFVTGEGLLRSTDLKNFTFLGEEQGLPVLTIKTYDGTEKQLVRRAKEIKDLAVHPQNPQILVATTDSSVYITKDGGDSWKSLGFSSGTSGAKAVAVADMPIPGAQNEDGSFKEVEVYGKSYKGRALYDILETYVRKAFVAIDKEEKEKGKDILWFIWAAPSSPLFGKDKMATFERCFLAETETHEEKKNPYYRFLENDQVVENIFKEFGITGDCRHIVNGHVPVHHTEGESPIKCGGKLLIIDGGFSKAYQKVTGIAGYTLIYNSWGMILAAHEPFTSARDAITKESDILSASILIKKTTERKTVAETDNGLKIKERIAELQELLKAYRDGLLIEKL